MKPFQVLKPKNLDEAISLAEAHGDQAKYVAGGTDVVVKIKEDKLVKDYLISLKDIPALDEIVQDRKTGELRIGAMVTHRKLETSPLIKSQYTIIYDAVSNIGSVQIRNVATIGGNLVNAVPSADGAIPLIALDARVKFQGPKGEHIEDLVKFFLGPGQNILEASEILTEIVIPPLPPNTGSAYIKFGRRAAMELPLLGVGVALSFDENMEKCLKARICLGVAAPVPLRAYEAEKFLINKTIDEQVLDEAGRIAGEESKVRDSIRGVAWYRRKMVNVQVKRMGLKILERLRD
ncbi:MAG: xanthine dehydrogenase family protein subunit M [Desulfatiglandaceae bacterium]